MTPVVRVPLAVLLLALTLPSPATATESSEAAVRRAAEQLGRALAARELSRLEPLLPEHGTVRLQLDCLGPADGRFGRDQLRAVLGELLRDGELAGFEVLELESWHAPYAMIHARARVTDRFGRPARLELHLGFVHESGRWIVREIREAAP